MDLCAHYGFSAIPFTPELRTDQQYQHPVATDVLNGMLQAVTNRLSCALIAPAGLGKTNVLRALVRQLPEARYRVHYTKVTDLTKRDMCREIAAAVGAAPAGTYPTLVRRLQEHFTATTDAGGLRPVLILDDAHDMRLNVLGLVRILTNFEMDSRLVVSVVLAGQMPLGKMLRREELEDVARRLAFYGSLRQLSREEVKQYVKHRCTVVGASSTPFDRDAFVALYECGRGNLRATDRLALRALELGCEQKAKVADANHVAEARRQLWP